MCHVGPWMAFSHHNHNSFGQCGVKQRQHRPKTGIKTKRYWKKMSTGGFQKDWHPNDGNANLHHLSNIIPGKVENKAPLWISNSCASDRLSSVCHWTPSWQRSALISLERFQRRHSGAVWEAVDQARIILPVNHVCGGFGKGNKNKPWKLSTPTMEAATRIF